MLSQILTPARRLLRQTPAIVLDFLTAASIITPAIPHIIHRIRHPEQWGTIMDELSPIYNPLHGNKINIPAVVTLIQPIIYQGTKKIGRQVGLV